MNLPEHGSLSEWIDLELDGELDPARAALLRDHLAQCDECRNERRRLQSLGAALAASLLAPAPDFTPRVMEALPAAGWETRHPRTWGPAVAVAGGLLVGAALLIAAATGSLQGPAVLGVVNAVLDLLAAALVAGAGLLGASWRGIGMALRAALGSSTGELALFAGVVTTLDLFFLWLWRGTRRSLALRREVAAEGRRRKP